MPMAADPKKLSPLLTVKEVLDQYPQALLAFMQLRLHCIGCPTEVFHTLADVAREYNVDLEMLVERIQSVITERQL
jgi:hybrid cluster-associated redox disulfide protein